MLSRSGCSSWRYFCRQYSQVTTFRTTETAPAHHKENHVGLFYTLNPDTCKHLYGHGGLPKNFMKQTKTFTETALMVRQPALNIIECINSTDMQKPVVRYVLYGEKGVGKSLSMAHVLHFAHTEGYVIVHVPWVSEWLRRTPRHKEVALSATKEGQLELPLDAAAWLLHFKTQNQAAFKNHDLKLSREYVWSKREKTEAGASIGELVEHGISRVKYACDVIDALLTELKLLSSSGRCKMLVALDGFNSFFYPSTRLRSPANKHVLPDQLTLTRSFTQLVRNDWCGGAVVLTVDQLAVPEDRQHEHYPLYLLYKQGFELLDPFVPIEVERYSEAEFASCASYYRDRLWLGRAGGAAELAELEAISARNPYRFMELCAPL